ncbi:MAG: efflux RND transporter permease subunit [bacterium]|nr:efflux RND transporter permease subunit [bacterium]
MNPASLAVRRPITTAMLLLSILLFGGIALTRLPVEFLPEVDIPFIAVEIPYDNTNPAQVEREITKPVEEILATLPGIKRLGSDSNADGAFIFLEFNWGHDLDIVRMQVSEKMDQVEGELPEQIGEIRIFSFNSSDIPVVEARISAEGVDMSENYQLLEARVLNRIRRIPGVAKVELDGVEPREIFVELVLDKVKEHGVDVGELIQLLNGASSNLVLGEVQDGGLRYTARALGSFESVQELRELVIDERGLRLADIAEISYEEPPIRYGRHLNRKDAVALTVFKESTANTVEVVNAVMGVIENDIDGDPLLQGVSLFVWQNQAEQITGALNGLTRAGLIGALLAVLVLYFFLRRLGSTLIVSMSIPFSIIAACGVMYFMGKTLNVLSMMGLMLGVGMLVDNAIVILESIDRTKRSEPDPKKAALKGTKSVSMAVIASTATSLIVFLPLIVGGESELTVWLGEVGIAIALALVCSLVSSLTLIPLMTSRFLPAGKSKPIPLMARTEDRYVHLLHWTLRHKLRTFLLIVGGAGFGFLPFFAGWVDMSQFSGAVNERLYLDYEFTDFVYKSQAEDVVDVVEQHLEPQLEELGVASMYSFYTSNRAGTTLTLARKDLGDKEVKKLRQKIRDGLPEIPGVKLAFFEDADSGGGSTYFSVNFFGQDSGVLAKFGDEAKRRLETVEGVQDITTSFGKSRKEIQVQVDRDKAARLGLTAQEVADTFSFTLGSFRLPRFNDGKREVETSLGLRIVDRENLADLKEIPFRDVDGRPVTLGDVATFEVVEKPEEIERQDRKVRAAVRATYEGENWDEAREEITALMDAFDLPGGYSWSWNRRMIEQDQQGAEMGVNMLLALVLIYLVMASLFESLAQPFSILFSILFALPGVAWLLAATDTPFNLMSWIGFLILMGIVVNNGIVLLDHMNQLRKEGLGIEESILMAGRDRMRAVLMTASTTIIGLLPLAIGGSRVGGLFYYPLAITVMGGLMSSAVLTLVVLPYINWNVEFVAAWIRRLWRESGAVRSPRRVESARPVETVEVVG